MVEVRVGIEQAKLIRGVIVFVALALEVKRDQEASTRGRNHL